ncbi:hypothetical protein EGW08_016377, partial [Elysia chlorotica]
PCSDARAVSWVRDDLRCDRYYICRLGQPLTMPACPTGQVWSEAAHNCVPETSRWNDCPASVHFIQSRTSTGQYTSHTGQYNTHMPRRKFRPSDQRDPSHKAPSNVKTPRDHPGPEADVDFWGNLRLALEETATTQRPAGNRSASTRDNHPRHDGVWSKTNPQPRSTPEEGNFYSMLRPNFHSTPKALEETHTSKWKGHQRQPLYPRPTTQADTLGKKSMWFSRLPEEESSDQRRHNPCVGGPGELLPHPLNCHWYYNCSSSSSRGRRNNHRTKDHYSNTNWLVWECRYPQLFDPVTRRCREFMGVACQGRFEPVDQCEYSARQCPPGAPRCTPCRARHGTCRGRKNGVYPLHGPHAWSPVFITCYLQRNIARDECSPPRPVFSPHKLDCVSLFQVPKQHGGFQPDCSTRPDGHYPDEQGRCAIYFRCALGHFRGYDECPPGSVFDPAKLTCETYRRVPSAAISALDQSQYTDTRGKVRRQIGVIPGPSPCEALPTGVYPDQATGCQFYIECYRGVLLTNGTCGPGTLFSAITGRCDAPSLAPPPCGTSDVCVSRPDGRYPAPLRGCSFYVECKQVWLEECDVNKFGWSSRTYHGVQGGGTSGRVIAPAQ